MFPASTIKFYTTLLFFYLVITSCTLAQNDFWVPLHGPAGTLVRDIIVKNENELLTLTNNTIYHSTDQGSSWQFLASTPVFTSQLAFTDGGFLFAGIGEDAVLRSDNNGETWQNVGGSLPIFTIISDFATQNGMVYATTNLGLHRITEDGSNWQSIPLDALNLSTIAIDENGLLFVGSYEPFSGASIFRSLEGGNSWTEISNGLEGTRVRNIQPMGDNSLYAAIEDGGLFHTSLNGASWTQIEVPFPDQNISALGTDGAGTLFVAAPDHGVFRSQDDGESWDQLSSELTKAKVNQFCQTVNQVLVLGSAEGMFRSLDNGWIWTPANVGLPKPYITGLAETIDRRLFATTSIGLFYSTDQGTTWMQDSIIDQSTQGVSHLGDNNIIVGTDYAAFYRDSPEVDWQIDSSLARFIGAASNSMGTTLGLTTTGKIFHSLNGGQTWEWLGVDLSTLSIGITTTPENEFWLGTEDKLIKLDQTGLNWEEEISLEGTFGDFAIDAGGDLIVGTSTGLYKVENGANTLTSFALNDIHINSLLISEDSVIYVGTTLGAFISEDGGNVWTLVNSGIDNQSITQVIIDNTGMLLAGTESGGLFKSSEPVITSAANSLEFDQSDIALYPNYPNPFSEGTNISFYLPDATQVSLEIADYSGKSVQKLLEQFLLPGKHQVFLEGTSLPVGLYVLRLQTNRRIETTTLLKVN